MARTVMGSRSIDDARHYLRLRHERVIADWWAGSPAGGRVRAMMWAGLWSAPRRNDSSSARALAWLGRSGEIERVLLVGNDEAAAALAEPSAGLKLLPDGGGDPELTAARLRSLARGCGLLLGPWDQLEGVYDVAHWLARRGLRRGETLVPGRRPATLWTRTSAVKPLPGCFIVWECDGAGEVLRVHLRGS